MESSADVMIGRVGIYTVMRHPLAIDIFCGDTEEHLALEWLLFPVVPTQRDQSYKWASLEEYTEWYSDKNPEKRNIDLISLAFFPCCT